MILVTGATGNVGRQIVEQLVTAGEPVRALSRHPDQARWPAGIEGVAGDLAEGLGAEVFEGVRAVHLFPVPERAHESLQHAKAAGVAHVTVLSSLAAELESDSPLRRRHTDLEDAAEASGLTWTHVRPGMSWPTPCSGRPRSRPMASSGSPTPTGRPPRSTRPTSRR